MCDDALGVGEVRVPISVVVHLVVAHWVLDLRSSIPASRAVGMVDVSVTIVVQFIHAVGNFGEVFGTHAVGI